LPPDNDTRDGQITFVWQPTGPLPSGAGYEVVWWNPGEDPANARGIAPPTTENTLAANLDVIYYGTGQVTGKSINWTVLVVQNTPYLRLTQPGAGPARILLVPAAQ
jgi:hypothetical protein